jgi:hypothetical protein
MNENIFNDRYQFVLNLAFMSDEELARKLQEEEENNVGD